MNPLHGSTRLALCCSALALVGLLACPTSAQTVYRCKSAKGVVYSQAPCGDNAERREMQTSQSAGSAGAPPHSGAFVDLGNDAASILAGSASAVLEKFGEPAGRYFVDDSEFWLFEQLGRIEKGGRQMLELRVLDGTTAQISWLPEAVMRKSVAVARKFAGWRPPVGPRNKTIFVTGGDMRGLNKVAVVARCGEPDVKKVLNGIEVWEYRGVPMSEADPTLLTLHIEFSGDNVNQTAGN